MLRSKTEAYEMAGAQALAALREAERRFEANPQAGALGTPVVTIAEKAQLRAGPSVRKCAYCGAPAMRSEKRPTTCSQHRDLPALDPFYTEEAGV